MHSWYKRNYGTTSSIWGSFLLRIYNDLTYKTITNFLNFTIILTCKGISKFSHWLVKAEFIYQFSFLVKWKMNSCMCNAEWLAPFITKIVKSMQMLPTHIRIRQRLNYRLYICNLSDSPRFINFFFKKKKGQLSAR